MIALLVALASAAPAQPADHEARNPLYKELLAQGIEVGKVRATLPPPTMPDGLDGAKQKAVIEGLIAKDYSYAEFTRKSVVAPQLLRIRDLQPSDPAAPARGVDLWFVTYGDFNATDDEKFLERLTNTGRGEGSGKQLTREQLAKRGITLTAEDEKRESYGFAEFDFLEKVKLKATGRLMWTKAAGSVVVAARLDPRFVNDPEFPDQWQPITTQGGKKEYGPPQPYSGAGFYLKITKLHEPAGAIFVEQHVVFAEPAGWFGGANLLRSKLPLVVQDNVRKMRREWLKTGK
jgi:hypothetical protein